MKICIIGGGAAGMMAAATAEAESIILFEKNEKLGKKIYITGKGRCNITNNSPVYEFVENIVSGKKFMMSSISAFPPPSTMEFLDNNGLRTKTERGGRVFPITDKSSDIIKAFAIALAKNNVDTHLNETVKAITKNDEVFNVRTNNGDYVFDKVIIATGGVSYKSTGSTGDGYRFAREYGHKIIPTVPGLTSIELFDDVKALEGLSLKNVRATVCAEGKSIGEFGEMLFTDKGVSGPVILTLSSYVNRMNLADGKLSIDFKPALSAGTLDDRLQSDIVEMPNRSLANILQGLLPKAIIPFVLGQSGVSEWTKGNSLKKESRFALGYSIKNLQFKLKSLAEISYAVITAGGVCTSEINSKTMESKLVKGLYFAGEVLDVDALTGGYNLQIALSTGFAAGKFATDADE